MTASSTPESRTEYALVIDCTLQGCDPKHSDDGELLSIKSATARKTVNGHAARLVSRTVLYSEWDDHPQQ